MRNRLLFAFGSSLSISIIIGLTNFISQIIYARMLGVEIISDYAEILIFTQIVNLIVSTGLNHAAISLGSEPQYLRAGWIIQLVVVFASILLLGAAILLALAIFPNSFFSVNAGLLGLSLIGTLAILLGHMINVNIEYNLYYGKLYSIRFIATLLSNILGVVLTLYFSSALPMVFRDFIFGVAFLVLSYVVASARTREILFSRSSLTLVWDDIFHIARLSRSNWSINLIGAAIIRVDYWLVALLLGHSYIGIYYQMRALVDGALAVGLGAIQSVLFSFFSSKPDSRSGLSLVRNNTLIGFVFAGISALVAATVGTEVIGLLLGPTWISGGTLLIGLSAYAVFRSSIEIFISFAKARQMQFLVLRGQIIWLVLQIIAVPSLISLWGLFGAGAASALAAGVVLIELNRRLTKKLHTSQ